MKASTLSPERIELNSMTLTDFNSLKNKNKIINGNFDIWQRATTQTSSGYGSDDRWHNTNVGSTKTASRQSFTVGQIDVPNNPKYFSRTVVSSSAGASNLVTKDQRIESVYTLAGKTVTLSFWAKADSSKDIAASFAQEFGTGGSPSSIVNGIGSTTCSLTTSWQKFIVTADIPSISGKTLGTNGDDIFRVRFWFDAGSDFDSLTNSLGQQSGTFDIAQVQLEEGSVATDFEKRSYGIELKLCERFYQILGTGMRGSWTAATTCELSGIFPTEMRGTPTASILTATPEVVEVGITGRTGSGSSIASAGVSSKKGISDIVLDGFSGASAGNLASARTESILGFDSDL